MKSYCEKQKRQTEFVPGSETYVISKNNRTMLKCICQECHSVKTKFVISQGN